jgi:GTP:adenosylcobinamide-phosphate guanylyltransferase
MGYEQIYWMGGRVRQDSEKPISIECLGQRCLTWVVDSLQQIVESIGVTGKLIE